MDKKEKQQLDKKSDGDLLKDVQKQRDELWALRRDLAAGKVKNVREIKRHKKSIAHILTLLSWRQKNKHLQES
ncbi:MAG: 50S ribosomal protein L29 [Candidatus Harrisonbacteria bacterium CG10_big_fil_rev_8_21_14_0_10_42_17]|uniref:Large ribosomal subunit protein uL29 n=1 Tax=Candidatus Harrisonbacteria bacterium CG10_big_fil_rev_8_21_14_0_10_42_17 TaxID=1974584 RepID=A0A2M6WHS5_9BACT|nr:MAG: 50S ribosomal protein L29 [Candidatus Harrisonbacteria bacterium CG10_big_fil_rev_8_21_14_0_10_42_17]